MDYALSLINSKDRIKTIALDILALSFIYFTPAISHLFNFPIYYLDPMRIMLILSLAHTSRKNSYIIALSLPLFSFIISSHPSIAKTFLISAELSLNIWLFYFISKKIRNEFVSILGSIVASKLVYYFLKIIFIQINLIDGELITTPIYIQVLTTIAFSTYIYFLLSKKKS